MQNRQMSYANNDDQFDFEQKSHVIKWCSIPVWIWLPAAVAITLSLFYAKIRLLNRKRLSRGADKTCPYASPAACGKPPSQYDVKGGHLLGAGDLTAKHRDENDLEKGICDLTTYSMASTQPQNERRPRLPQAFKIQKLAEGFSAVTGRINCCKPFDSGRRLVIGTDLGVFVKRNDEDMPTKVPLDINLVFQIEVLQIEVLEQHGLLVILADRMVYTFPLEALETESNLPATSRSGRKVCHASHIKSGTCNGQTLVCCVKSSSLSSTIKLFTPTRRIPVGQETSSPSLTPYKEFYIPAPCNSIHFLPSTICMACPTHFEVVSLETLETAPLLDEADPTLPFTHEPTSKPVYMSRNAKDLLLCYQSLSFYVSKHGWRARGDWKVEWENHPYAFATLGEEYIVAFWPELIEIRSSDSGALVGNLTQRDTIFLHQSSNEILFAYKDEQARDVIASLELR